MTEPMFAWQQEFDGTQSAPSPAEAWAAKMTFGVVVGSLIMKHMDHATPNKNGIRLTLLQADEEGVVTAAVCHKNVSVDAQVPEVLLHKTAAKQGPGEDTRLWPPRIASWYHLHNGLLIRQDIDRPTRHVLAHNDTPLSAVPIPDTDVARIARLYEEQRAIQDTEALLGFNRQPVGLDEVTSLAGFLHQAHLRRRSADV